MADEAAEIAAEVAERPSPRRLALDLRPLRERDFRRLWLGQAVSFIGSQVSTVAVPFQLYDLTGSTLAVGLLALCQLVPLLTLAIVGGAIADAVDRRRLALATEVGLALCALGFAGNAALPHPRIWALYVLETVTVALYAFGSPALRSLIGQPSCEGGRCRPSPVFEN